MAREVRGLNWGCGPALARGWWNADVVDYGQDLVGDIASGLAVEDAFFDGVVANHSLQCLTYAELDVAVIELHRVLRPGGRLRVLVPDVIAAFDAYRDSNELWPGFTAISEWWDIDRKFAHYLTWGGSNRSCFTPVSLAALLDRHGFMQPRDGGAALSTSWRWLCELDSRLEESIVIEAQA